MTVRITRKTLAVVGVLAAVFAGTTAFAAIPDGGGVIHGCYDKASGAMRVTDTATNVPKACTAKEVALNWNQQGPKGDPGVQGPKGDPGSSDGYIRHPLGGVGILGGTQVASMYVPAGSYMLSAKFLMGSFTPNQLFTCSFGAGADIDKLTGNVNDTVTNSYFGLTTAHTFDVGGWLVLSCNSTNIVVAQDITLTAIKVGEIHVS